MSIEVEDRGLTESQAAEFLGVSKTTLRIARSRGNAAGKMPSPPFYKLSSRCVRYSERDLREWRDARRVEGVS